MKRATGASLRLLIARILAITIASTLLTMITPTIASANAGIYENAYNIHRVVTYARQYWNKENENFPTLSKVDFEVLGLNPKYWTDYDAPDCTNFVSQCLYDGGLKLSSDWSYYGGRDGFHPWTVAPDLYKYLIGLGYSAEKLSDSRPIKPGDVVFFDWGKGEGISHATICVKKDNSEVYMAQHSNNREAQSFSAYKQSEPNLIAYVVHMTDSNNMSDVTSNFHNKRVVIVTNRPATKGQFILAGSTVTVGPNNPTVFTVKVNNFGEASFVTDDNKYLITYIGTDSEQAHIDRKYAYVKLSSEVSDSEVNEPWSWSSFRIYQSGNNHYVHSQINGKWLQVSSEGYVIKAAAKEVNEWELFKICEDGQTLSAQQLPSPSPHRQPTQSVGGNGFSYTANSVNIPNVWFRGGDTFAGANGKGKNTQSSVAGWVTVTFQTTDMSAPYPYHVVHQDGGSTVYGWVAENELDFGMHASSISTPSTTETMTSSTVKVDDSVPVDPTPANTVGWTRESTLPANAVVKGTKWVYDLTQTYITSNPSVSGWTQTNSEWILSGSGSLEWAAFPSGFSAENTIYKDYGKSTVEGYDNGSTKRIVSNSRSNYIYWHWVYEPGYPGSSVDNRYIEDKYGLGTGGFFYDDFHAVLKNENYPYDVDAGAYKWNAGQYWSYYWYRLDLMMSTYEDYTKVYKYSRTIRTESATYPIEGNVSNIQMYVQYERTPQTIAVFIGYPQIDTSVGRISIDNSGTSPVIHNGRTLLPVRAIIEAMNGTVVWDGTSDPSRKKVTCIVGNYSVEMFLGDEKFYVNGQEYKFDVPPTIINSRTMIPVRALFEAISCKVDWVKNGGGNGWDMVSITYYE